MSEKPILFSGPMVRAILDGRKSQTRRVYKPTHIAPGCRTLRWENQDARELLHVGLCPYGRAGDRLWVREKWGRCNGAYVYEADGRTSKWQLDDGRWKPSIHMPRWASRITLEITAVRVERVQDISDADCVAEGMEHDTGFGEQLSATLRNAWYMQLWDSINGKAHPWASNPWVWVVEFKRVKPA